MKPLLALNLKNQIKVIDPTLQVQLQNVRVNGVPFGCSGFISDPATDAVVYVNTDHNHGTSHNNAVYRTARHTKDYTGGLNHFAEYDQLARAAVALIESHGRQLKQERVASAATAVLMAAAS